MSLYNTIKALINSSVRQNAEGEITGNVMNATLNTLVEQVGTKSGFMGVATPDTEVASNPDARQFYVTNINGTYSQFGGYTNTENNAVVFYYDGASWGHISLTQEVSIRVSHLEESAVAKEEVGFVNANTALRVMEFSDLHDAKLQVKEAGLLVPGGIYAIYADSVFGLYMYVSDDITLFDEDANWKVIQ